MTIGIGFGRITQFEKIKLLMAAAHDGDGNRSLQVTRRERMIESDTLGSSYVVVKYEESIEEITGIRTRRIIPKTTRIQQDMYPTF